MRVTHPLSFFLAIVIIVLTAAISVTWSDIHVVGLVLDIVLIGLLRYCAIWEGHRRLAGKP